MSILTSSTFRMVFVKAESSLLCYIIYNYVNSLSKNLNKVPAGCCIKHVLINKLMCADDMVLIAPSMK